MKTIFGILLFTLCITTGAANAVAADDGVSTQAKTELLENSYVELAAVPSTQITSISVTDAASNIVRLLRARYVSLLNWAVHNRRQNLEIENYDRKAQFGRWINDPNDDVCYNTRAKVLVRDSIKTVNFKETNHCAVLAGDWKDPYTKTDITEAKGIQIDHLVPLKNAYISGAYKWSFRARCLYANYLGIDFHLLSVDGTQNMKKGDRTPAGYMPPNSQYTCTYVRNWLAVKMIWGLNMTIDEANAIHKIIMSQNCNIADFRMTDNQISTQRQFALDNIDLCEKIDKASRVNQPALDPTQKNNN